MGGVHKYELSQVTQLFAKSLSAALRGNEQSMSRGKEELSSMSVISKMYGLCDKGFIGLLYLPRTQWVVQYAHMHGHANIRIIIRTH